MIYIRKMVCPLCGIKSLGTGFEPARPLDLADNRTQRPIETGVTNWIRTRTVRVTGGDADSYITTLKINWPAIHGVESLR
jgi:hypothetical protein